jgi:hypothetical protein
MKTPFLTLAVLFSVSAIGQPAVYSSNAPANNGVHAGMQGLVIFTVILAGIMLISKLNKVHKCLILAIIFLSAFLYSKFSITPGNSPTSSKTSYRIK